MPRTARHYLGGAVLFALLAWAQLTLGTRQQVPLGGDWFLYGRDTVFHDAPAHLWVQQQLARFPGAIPLWNAQVQGGIPTLGAFFWTPFSPNVWPLHFFEYPRAQWWGWWMALWIAGIGGMVLGRALGLRFSATLAVGASWMLTGHVVTLIHAGHFQKVVALGWLPWAVAGAVMIARGQRIGPGIATGGGAIGAMLLGGHPQIAYAALATSGLVVAWSLALQRRRRWLAIPAYVGMATLGLALGAAQMIPGMEMAAVSNRAGGVGFEEAVETSYPPGELMEFASQRWKGSSIGGDVYTGDWGERIVSDYAGRPVLALALAGLVLSMTRRNRRRFRVPLPAVLFAVLALIAILVGLGRYTPLYRVLYDWLPGFRSFRSPATFFCVASLSVAVLAGVGLDVVGRLARQKSNRAMAGGLAVLLLAACIADLASKNRTFLLRHSWADYRAYLMRSTEADEFIALRGIEWETHDATNELGLRPMLHGRRALNGYHPVFLGIKEARDRELGFNTKEWFAAWGIGHVLAPANAEGGDGVSVVARFTNPPRSLLALDGSTDAAPWTAVGMNAWVAKRGVATSIPGAVMPGFVAWSGDREVFRAKAPGLSIPLDGMAIGEVVRWEYRPFSYRVGLFLTAMALSIIAAIGGRMLFPRAPRSRTVSEPLANGPQQPGSSSA